MMMTHTFRIHEKLETRSRIRGRRWLSGGFHELQVSKQRSHQQINSPETADHHGDAHLSLQFIPVLTNAATPLAN